MWIFQDLYLLFFEFCTHNPPIQKSYPVIVHCNPSIRHQALPPSNSCMEEVAIHGNANVIFDFITIPMCVNLCV